MINTIASKYANITKNDISDEMLETVLAFRLELKTALSKMARHSKNHPKLRILLRNLDEYIQFTSNLTFARGNKIMLMRLENVAEAVSAAKLSSEFAGNEELVNLLHKISSTVRKFILRLITQIKENSFALSVEHEY